jgi:hypothetical protein
MTDADGRTLFVPADAELFRMAKIAKVDVREHANPSGIWVTKDLPEHRSTLIGPRWEPHINDTQCRQVLLTIPAAFQGDYVVALYGALGYDDEAASEKTWEFWAINAPPDIKIKAVCELEFP